MVIALAALCGVLVAGGFWVMFVGFNSHTLPVPKLPTRLWTNAVDKRMRRVL